MSARAATFIALVVLLGLALAGPAEAAPEWLAPANLSAPGRDATEPQVAVDGSGGTVAVWARSNGSETITQASSRPAGGTWTQAVDLSAAGRDASEPAVAVGPAGNAVAVWARWNGLHWVIQGASRTSGGGWTATGDISDPERSATEPQVALDAGGRATAVWSRFDGSDDIVQSAVLGAASGSAWTEPDDLSAPGEDAEEPQVAIDGGGDAIAVWSRLEGTDKIAQATRRPSAGDWESADDLSDAGGDATEPQLAVDPVGDAIAVWSREVGTLGTIQSAEMAAGGEWSEVLDLTGAGEDATEPQAALAPGGRALAVWSLVDSGPYSIIQAAEKPAGGAWLPTQDLTLTGLTQTVQAPQVAIDPNGSVAAVWARSSASPTVIEGRIKPAGGGWLGIDELSVLGDSAVEPQVALGATGDGATVWSRDNGANSIVQAAGFDGAGPQFPSLSIPAAATVRQPVEFSAVTFDNWSPVRPVSWGFGDGGGATGWTVDHTFTSPGVYSISIAAVDGLGNGGATVGSITIHRLPNAGRNVRVRRGAALLRVHCPSPAGCTGVVKLIARVEFERRGRIIGKRLVIGRRAFAIPGAGTTTVPVPLTGKGRKGVNEAGRKGLRTQLTGPGVQHRLVLLLPARSQG